MAGSLHSYTEVRSGVVPILKVVVASITILFCLVLYAVVSSSYRSGCAGELPPIANLRTINTAEVTYLSQSGSYGTTLDLIAAGLLDDTYMGTKAGYNYTITLDATGSSYTAEAVPGPVVPKRRSWFSSTDS